MKAARVLNNAKNTHQVHYDLVSGALNVDLNDGEYVVFGSVRRYYFTSAITANVTTTTAPAGSKAETSHATGRMSIFVSDGTKWQYLTNA